MKNILITGASGNLGRTVVAAFREDSGYHVNIISREDQPSSDHLKAFNIDLLNDVAAASLIEELAASQVPLNAVIFLTGGYTSGDIVTTSAADILKMMEINVLTAHNIVSPLIKITKASQRKLTLIFIGAKAAMDTSAAMNNLAYALSKKALFHYVELINESEQTHGTSAHIILPGTLDTALNRGAMPEANFNTWTQPLSVADQIKKIISGTQSATIIEL